MEYGHRQWVLTVGSIQFHENQLRGMGKDDHFVLGRMVIVLEEW